MNSEKVKDIKEALASSFCPYIDYVDTIGEPKMKRLELRSVINLIKELESENERLSNALEDNVTAYKEGFQDGASLKGTIKNELIKENKQLKDRIVELEKENAKLKGE